MSASTQRALEAGKAWLASPCTEENWAPQIIEASQAIRALISEVERLAGPTSTHGKHGKVVQ